MQTQDVTQLRSTLRDSRNGGLRPDHEALRRSTLATSLTTTKETQQKPSKGKSKSKSRGKTPAGRVEHTTLTTISNDKGAQERSMISRLNHYKRRLKKYIERHKSSQQELNYLAAQNQALQDQQAEYLQELKERDQKLQQLAAQADQQRQESHKPSYLAEQLLKEREDSQKIIYQLNQETLALVRDIQNRDEKHKQVTEEN